MKQLTILALVAMFIIPAAAQSSHDQAGPGDQHWTLISAQLGESLKSSDEAVKTQALKNAVIFATLYRDKITMQDHFGSLRDVYEDSDNQMNQGLALAAIQVIGGGIALDYLSRNVDVEETEQARLLVASILNEYYQTRLAIGPAFEIG